MSEQDGGVKFGMRLWNESREMLLEEEEWTQLLEVAIIWGWQPHGTGSAKGLMRFPDSPLLDQGYVRCGDTWITEEDAMNLAQCLAPVKDEDQLPRARVQEFAALCATGAFNVSTPWPR